MEKNLDKGGYICAILMDLSKVFDTLSQNLSIAKLGAYGFDAKPLKDNKKQKVGLNSNISS